MRTLVSTSGNLTVTKNSIISGVEYGDKIAKAIADAVANGKLSSIGLDREMEDNGSGIEVPTENFIIEDETVFSNFVASTDPSYTVQEPVAVQNNKDAQVWLVTDTDVFELPRIQDKITGKVLRYHVSNSNGKPVGLSITFQAIKGGELKTESALIGMDYLQSVIGKGTLTTAMVLNWANTTIQDKCIVLGYRTTVEGKTGYFKSIEKFNTIEMDAYKKADKKSIKRNDKDKFGFIHRVSNTNYTYQGIASDTETLQYTTQVSRLSELTIKVAEKSALDNVDLQTLDKRNAINAGAIEHHMQVAKSMLTKGLLTQQQFDARISQLLEKFGM